MKKIMLTAAAAVLALAMTGCTFTTTVTKTETKTDANGNTTTHTSTTTNENGKITTSETVEVVEATKAEAENGEIVATLAFENDTELEIHELYFSSALSDNWGRNLLAEGDTMPAGDKIAFRDGFTYFNDAMEWDMKAVDADGLTLEIKGLNMANAADPTNILILLTHDAEADTYTVYIR